MTFSSVLFTFFGCLHLVFQLNKLYTIKFANHTLLFHRQSNEADNTTLLSEWHTLHHMEVNNTGAISVLWGAFHKFSTIHSIIRRHSKMQPLSLPLPTSSEFCSVASTSDFSKALVKVAFHDSVSNVMAPTTSSIVHLVDKAPRTTLIGSDGNFIVLYFVIIATCVLVCTMLLLNILTDCYVCYHNNCKPCTALPLLLPPCCENSFEGEDSGENQEMEEEAEEEFADIEIEPSWEVDSVYCALLNANTSIEYYELLNCGDVEE